MQVEQNDIYFMHRAFKLAKRGAFSVSPNPLVGALLVKNGKIITEGWHKKFGGPHAEIETLNNAYKKGKNQAGSTLYVTLEPCVHEQKKTPPCVPEIIGANIQRVVLAMKDPNPYVSGRGIAALRKAGIKVRVGCLEHKAKNLNEKYVKWMKTKIPFIGMKVAMSLDGKIATRIGDSKWITSEASRAYVKKLRDLYDGILLGVGTVMKDNPTLLGNHRKPLRIILDSTLRSPLTLKVFRDSNVVVATTARASQKKIKIFQKRGIPLKIFPKKIQLTPLLRFLGKRGISSILVEGGSEIFGSFIDEKLADKFYWFIAPKIIGGRGAKPALQGKGIRFLSQAITLDDVNIQRIGEDFLIDGISLHRSTQHIPK